MPKIPPKRNPQPAAPSSGTAVAATTIARGAPKGIPTTCCSSVLDIATLAMVDDTTLNDGFTHHVSKLEDPWILDKSGTLAVDGITCIMTRSGTGRWIRRPLHHPQWLARSAWYIDAVDGNDENDGASAMTALKTLKELTRRWGKGWYLDHAVTIHILRDLLDDDRGDLEGTIGASGSLECVGGYGALRTGTFTGVRAVDPANNLSFEIEDSQSGSWSALSPNAYNQFILLVPSKELVATSNADVGGGKLQTSSFHVLSPTGFSGYQNPVVGDTYVVPELPRMPTMNIRVHAQDNEYDPLPGRSRVNFKLLRFDRSVITESSRASYVSFLGCIFEGRVEDPTTLESSGNSAQLEINNSSVLMTGCVLHKDLLVFATYSRWSCQACTFAMWWNPTIRFCTVDLFGSVMRVTFPSSYYSRVVAGSTVRQEMTTHIVAGTDARLVADENNTVVLGHIVGGAVAPAYVFQVNNGGVLIRNPGAFVHATGAVTQFIVDGATALMPALENMNGTLPPAPMTCTTFSQVSAAPFHGSAINYRTGSRVLTH